MRDRRGCSDDFLLSLPRKRKRSKSYDETLAEENAARRAAEASRRIRGEFEDSVVEAAISRLEMEQHSGEPVESWEGFDRKVEKAKSRLKQLMDKTD